MLKKIIKFIAIFFGMIFNFCLFAMISLVLLSMFSLSNFGASMVNNIYLQNQIEENSEQEIQFVIDHHNKTNTSSITNAYVKLLIEEDYQYQIIFITELDNIQAKAIFTCPANGWFEIEPIDFSIQYNSLNNQPIDIIQKDKITKIVFEDVDQLFLQKAYDEKKIINDNFWGVNCISFSSLKKLIFNLNKNYNYIEIKNNDINAY